VKRGRPESAPRARARTRGTTLAGRAVRLTPLRQRDAEAMFGWINAREDVLFNAPYRPVGEGAHLAWFESRQHDRDGVIFAIRPLQDDRLVGYCQLVNVQWVHRSAELRIRLGTEADRGRGFGTDAVRLLVEFAFRDLNLRRVFVHVFADNTRAARVYEKVGFVREGVLREAVYIDARYVDIVVMGILRPE
jgi:RimJ/RimL family protein N-acetyltransferase